VRTAAYWFPRTSPVIGNSSLFRSEYDPQADEKLAARTTYGRGSAMGLHNGKEKARLKFIASVRKGKSRRPSSPLGPRPLPRRYAVDSTQQSTSMSGYPVHRSIPPTQGTVPTPFFFPNIPSLKPDQDTTAQSMRRGFRYPSSVLYFQTSSGR
jgi:hypothetical protein